MLQKNVLSITLLLFLGWLPEPRLAAAPATPPVPQCAEQHARAVIDGLLDWNIPLARQRLTSWESNYPQHPSLPLYKAMTLVAEADYSGSREVSRYNPPLKALKKVIKQNQQALNQGDHAWLTRLNLATAQAVAGRLLMEQGHWLSAFNHGYESRQTMQRLLAEDPTRLDAKLILGMFEYITGTVPASVKWLTALVGFSGEESKGIAYLEEVVEAGVVAAPEAAEALLVEVKHPPARSCRYLDLAATMHAHYPHNPRYSWAKIRLEQACKKAAQEKRQAIKAFTLAKASCP